MRKIVVTEFITLDGVIEDPGGSEHTKNGGWSMPYFDDEIGKFKYDELFNSDVQLLGRITYEGFAAAWPGRTEDGDFGDKMNNMPKYVVSTTLKKAEWNNTAILNENVKDEVAKLKEGGDKDILVAGSSKLSQWLLRENLIDQFNLLVYPIVLGEGKRLFEGTYAKLKLLESKQYGSGVVLLKYETTK